MNFDEFDARQPAPAIRSRVLLRIALADPPFFRPTPLGYHGTGAVWRVILSSVDLAWRESDGQPRPLRGLRLDPSPTIDKG